MSISYRRPPEFFAEWLRTLSTVEARKLQEWLNGTRDSDIKDQMADAVDYDKEVEEESSTYTADDCDDAYQRSVDDEEEEEKEL